MTQPLFRASEILDMAVRIEHQGLAFYQACREADLGSDVEKVLDYLIEQEERHVDVFSRMKEGLEDFKLPESYAGEMERYTDAFVKEKVFEEPKQASEEVARLKDPLQAIKWAISFERRSIEFYRDIEEIIRPSEKEILSQVIEEERKHIRRLNDLREKLKKEG
jgi:rubrerythrin